jgi:hypothetical protein
VPYRVTEYNVRLLSLLTVQIVRPSD